MTKERKKIRTATVVLLFILCVILLSGLAYRIGFDDGRLQRKREEVERKEQISALHKSNSSENPYLYPVV